MFAAHVVGHLAIVNRRLDSLAVSSVLRGGNIIRVVKRAVHEHHKIKTERRSLAGHGSVHVKDGNPVRHGNKIFTLLVRHVGHVFDELLLGDGIFCPVLEVLGLLDLNRGNFIAGRGVDNSERAECNQARSQSRQKFFTHDEPPKNYFGDYITARQENRQVPKIT